MNDQTPVQLIAINGLFATPVTTFTTESMAHTVGRQMVRDNVIEKYDIKPLTDKANESE